MVSTAIHKWPPLATVHWWFTHILCETTVFLSLLFLEKEQVSFVTPIVLTVWYARIAWIRKFISSTLGGESSVDCRWWLSCMMRACGISNLVHALDLLPLLLCFSASRFPQVLCFFASLVLCLENQNFFKHAHFNCSCCSAFKIDRLRCTTLADFSVGS